MVKRLKEIIETELGLKVFVSERDEMNLIADELGYREKYAQIIPSFKKEYVRDARNWEKGTLQVYFSRFVQLQSPDGYVYGEKAKMEREFVTPLIKAIRASGLVVLENYSVDYSVPSLYDANEVSLLLNLTIKKPLC